MAASSIRFTMSSTVPSSLLCSPITRKDTPSKSISEPMTLRSGNSMLSFLRCSNNMLEPYLNSAKD